MFVKDGASKSAGGASAPCLAARMRMLDSVATSPAACDGRRSRNRNGKGKRPKFLEEMQMMLKSRRTILRSAAAVGFAAALLGGIAAASAGEVRVTLAIYSDKTQPLFEEAAKAFEAAHPGTTIKVEAIPWDNLLQKLTTDISGGTPPDLAIIGTRWLIDFVKDDLIEPLDDRLADGTGAEFIETFLSPGRLNGKIYGLPIAASARAMFYNKDLLAKAGIDAPPKNWSELHADAKKIGALGGDVYGFCLQGQEIETDVYYYYSLWTHGGDILTPDGKSGLASDAAVKALTLYSDMIKDGSTQKGVTTFSREDCQELFKAGRAGFVITQAFLATQIHDEKKDVDYGIVPVPADEDGHSFTYGVTDSFVMFKASQVKDEAWAFTKFIFQPEWRVRFTKGEGFLPVTKKEAADPAFTENADLKPFIDSLPNAKFAPIIPGWEEIADRTIRALQTVYNGEAEPKAALDAAAADIDKILAKSQ
jgi:multiple sugar transport system substrate-binding protein